MSIKLVAQVWEYHWTHPEQGILLALADHAHDDGTHIFPSVEYVSWKSEYSERQVQRILSDLRAKGILVPIRFKGGGRGHATEYHLHLEKGVKKSPFKKKGDIAEEMGDIADLKGDIQSIKGDIAVSPQPPIESVYTNGEPAPGADDVDETENRRRARLQSERYREKFSKK